MPNRKIRVGLGTWAFLALLITALTACHGGGGDSGSGTNGPPPALTIGGSIMGLQGAVVLQNNGGDNLSVGANGSFVFGAPLSFGASYQVTVLTQPEGQTCSVTGGYLMEVDYWQGEDYCRNTNRGVWLCTGNPETLLEPEWAQHRAYIDGYIDATEDALYGPQFTDPVTGYAAYIDVDSNFFSSVFMYKKRGGKLTFGPVWDFDLSAGNAQWAQFGFFDGSDPTGWHTRKQDTRTPDTGTNWYARLFMDPAFEQKVRARWAQLRASGAIDLSPVLGPYSLHVDAMKSWLRQRVAWMDSQLR
jgi:hypothetical protein